jgi:hypothetical protein
MIDRANRDSTYIQNIATKAESHNAAAKIGLEKGFPEGRS